MEIQHLKRVIEAAILAAGQPLSTTALAGLFTDSEGVDAQAIAQALTELQADASERGVELVEVASGFRYQVRPDVHIWVSRLWTERQTRYSRALLETLALIAYRQPITRAEIEQIRGVQVSTQMVRTLEEREWIRVLGYRDVPGKPALLGTTRGFLDYFNLKSLDQLPPLAEIRDIEELEPELDLPGAGELPPDAGELAEAAFDGDNVIRMAPRGAATAPDPTPSRDSAQDEPTAGDPPDDETRE